MKHTSWPPSNLRLKGKENHLGIRYPRRIEMIIKGFHMFTAAYLGFTTYEAIIGRPVKIVLFFLALSLIPEAYCFYFKRRVKRRGLAVWKFKVLANTHFVFKRKKIDCVVATPLVAPYMDRMFEIILHDDEELPKVGTIIDVCLPGDVEVLDNDNRYIMAGHYEIRSQDAT